MGVDVSKIGDYVLASDKPIGEGGFGTVYKAKHYKKGHLAAVKRCIIKTEMHGSLAMKEIKTFQKIPPHKHIVQMLDYEYLSKSFWIVMEYCDRGDLESYMKKYTPNLERQFKIMYQCSCAVAHMHGQEEPIVHRDIKPQNILFKNEGGKEVVKMADFGLTKVVEATGGGDTAAEQLTSQVGTRPFMAPELYAGNPYNESVDTFALGLVFMAMINFKPTDEHLIPFSPAALIKFQQGEFVSIGQEMLQAKLSGEKDPVIVPISPLDGAKMKGIKGLITDMTKFYSKERKNMADVVAGLQKIATGASPSSMLTSESAVKGLMLSNLSLAQTKVGPSMGSTTYEDRPATRGAQKMPSTVKEEEEESSEDENAPDLAYLLMRRMLEDGLRRKREEEMADKRKSELDEAARMLPLMALLKLLDSDQESGSKYDVGDKVRVDKDMHRVRDLQQDHGGWAKGMEKYLNESGRITDVKEDIVNVKFDNGQSLRFNALLLTKVGACGDEGRKEARGGKLVKGKFKMLDVVKFKVDESGLDKLQKSHGGYNKRMAHVLEMRGVVHRVFEDGDIYVEFLNGDKWCLNPDALELVDTAGEEIEAGDVVIVIADKEKVIQLQKGHGEWSDAMTKCLGCSGIVRKVGNIGSSPNTVAVVEVGDSRWAWNINALKLIAKGEEMVLIMLKKAMTSG